MQVEVDPDIGIDFNGVKGVLAHVVVPQCNVHFFGKPGLPLLRMEADIDVRGLKDRCSSPTAVPIKANESNTDP